MIYSTTGRAHKVFLGSLLDLGATYKIQTRCTLGERSQESSAGSRSGMQRTAKKTGWRCADHAFCQPRAQLGFVLDFAIGPRTCFMECGLG